MIRKILILVALVAAFNAGMLIAGISHFSSPIISIEFINKSGKEVTMIDIIHKTGRFGEIRHSISNLKVGEERPIRMWVPAESSYELIVTFADKKRLTGGQGYVEPGYKVIETIERDKIKSDVRLHGGYGP